MAARSFLYGGAYDGDSGGGGSSVLLTNKRVHCSSSPNPIGSFFITGSSSSFLGSRSMVSFEDRGNGSRGQFFQSFDHEDNGDDEYDEYFHQPDQKKRRLTADQVRFLEKSFESENKLEPERKLQLAKELGLQPRQVAIWFQNRRARWKTKQLERDYDELQESYNKLKANYENLLNEKEKLKSEVHELSDKLLLQEKGTSDSSSSKSPSEPLLHQQILDCPYEEDVSRNMNPVNGQNCNFDNGVHTSLLERGDSSYVFEQEPSDGSLDEEVNFSKMFLPPMDGYMSRKIENADYPDPHSVASYYPGLPGDDQAFGFWSY